jgi:hypothetical protein
VRPSFFVLRKSPRSLSRSGADTEGQFLRGLSEAAKGLEKSAETAKSVSHAQQRCAERWIL